MLSKKEQSKSGSLLFFIVLFVFLIISAFFEEGVAYFDPVYTTKMSMTEAVLSFSLCLLLGLSVLFLAKRLLHISINWVFLSLTCVLLAVDIIAIVSFPTMSVATSVYHLTLEAKLYFILFWIIACLDFYVFFAIMPKAVSDTNRWSIYFLGGLFIAVVSCVYSYIFEWSDYFAVFKGTESRFLPEILSFTNNKNTFGTLIFVGIICSLLLHLKSHKWWYLLIGLLLLLNLGLVRSVDSFISSAFFACCYLFYALVISYRSRPIRNSIVLLICLSLVVFVCLIKPLGLDKTVPFLGSVSAFFDSNLALSGIGSSASANSRVFFWTAINQIIFSNPLTAAFGLGDWNFSWYLGSYIGGLAPCIKSAHNGFFDVLGRHGLVGLALYVAMLVYFVVLVVKLISKKHYSAFVSLFVFFSVLIHGLFEDTNFMNMQAKNMMLLFLAYMPVMTDYQLLKDKNRAQKEAVALSSATPKRTKRTIQPQSWAALSMAVATPIFAVLLGLAPFFSHYGGVSLFDNVYFLIQLGFIFIILPFIVFGLSSLRQSGHNNGFGVLMPLFFVFVLVDVILSISGIANLVSTIILGVVGLILAAVCFFPAKKVGFKKLLLSTFIYWLLEAVLILVSQYVVRYALFPVDAYQPYALMVLVLIDVSAVVFFAFASPLSNLLFIPYDDWWVNVETRYEYACIRYDARHEIRQIRNTKKKIPLRYQ